MKLDWNDDKSRTLKQERGIAFEDIVICIDEGQVLDIIDHPNHVKYPHQKIIVVSWTDYVYLVPCVKTADGFFLKTIIPSRKAKKEYLSERGSR
ncbi:MAG: toxin [Candidatus Omnitrophica bacterium]|nr:toxin [Candidatus Omnitrophota bacterium]